MEEGNKHAETCAGGINAGRELPPTVMKTKIVCTLGPATDSPKVIEELIRAGMDTARLNFSHGTHEDMKRTFGILREMGTKYSEQVSIICDIQGPKIRTGLMKEPFVVVPGQKIRVTPDEVIGTPECIQIKYPTILEDLHADDLIFINDGIIRLRIVDKAERALECVVEAGGQISDHKGCNIPSGNISLDVLSKKDKNDLKLIASLNPEYVAASFIGCAEDVRKVRRCLAENGNTEIKIISKIERPVALKNIQEIIAETDAVMVARGDLGVEIPTWEVPIAQKMIVEKCNKEGKPVIVATQMLESMTTSSRPTRAEANDVFNAVLDGADAVMLSGETSVGKYPVEAVQVMDRIVGAAEAHMPARNPEHYDSKRSQKEMVGHSCLILARALSFKEVGGKIIVVDYDGVTTKNITKYRPPMTVITVTPDLRVARELTMVWGVFSIHAACDLGSNIEEMATSAIKKVLEKGKIDKDEHAVVVCGSSIHPEDALFVGVYNCQVHA